SIYVLSDDIALSMLNDGNGIEISNSNSNDFTIELDGATTISVNLGPVYDGDGELEESAVSTVGQLIDRINEALDDVTGGQVTVGIASDGVSLEFEDVLGRDITLNDVGDKNVVAQLGFEDGFDYAGGTASGSRVIADLQGTLLSNLNGGSGVDDDGTQGELLITDRDGGTYTVNFDVNGTLSDLVRAIEDETGGLVSASIDATGTGLKLTDTTGGSGNLIVEGASADSLNVNTGASGVDADEVSSGDLDHKYFSRATTFDSLGIGTGEVRITDAQGNVVTVDIGNDTETIGDFIDEVNGQLSAAGSDATISINASGDGLIIEDTSGGSVALKVEDEEGNIASALGIAGEAEDTADNKIDGSFEVTVEFDATDTLQDIADKINASGANVTATIMNDGSTSLGYHLNIVSDETGRDGRFVVDTGSLDLDLDTLDSGEDARVFFGNSDPADAILLTNSSNSLDDAIAGVTIDLRSASEETVTVTVANDSKKVESAINAFVKAFNDAVTRIDEQTKYVVETEQKGPLLGDGTMIRLRADLFNAVQGEALNVDGPYSRLSEIGISVGEGGTLEFDVGTFRDAIDADRDGVIALMTAREFDPPNREIEIDDGITVNDPDAENTYTSMGFMTIFEELGKEYINSVDGVLTMRNRSLDDQIELQTDRIEFFDIQLANKRDILERQFLAMEKVIADLQVQQSALASLTSSLG
ncbi:MAG: flagellar filament capping protein FliD, partial [Phycisphaerales bacterium]|nr:flagellar filament capping protein FliD [Phycisphaerales bacterium]